MFCWDVDVYTPPQLVEDTHPHVHFERAEPAPRRPNTSMSMSMNRPKVKLTDGPKCQEMPGHKRVISALIAEEGCVVSGDDAGRILWWDMTNNTHLGKCIDMQIESEHTELAHDLR